MAKMPAAYDTETEDDDGVAAPYCGHFTVTPKSGYSYEAPQTRRFANSYGDDMTRLPPGHLARRDSPDDAKHAKATGGDDF